MESLKSRYSVSTLCRFLGISRSGYYAYLKRKDADKHKEVKELIHTMPHQLLADSLTISWSVGSMQLKPNQTWVTDITQYRVGEAWIYLSAIKDLFNNEIVAYHSSFRNNNELVLQTFAKAFQKNEDVTGLIVHSDQGFQYTSHAYHDMLPKVGAQISMSRRGNCHDNASRESFFSHLKTEGLYPYDIRSLDEAQRRIEEFIQFYNYSRPQRKLKKLPPVEYRRQLSA